MSDPSMRPINMTGPAQSTLEQAGIPRPPKSKTPLLVVNAVPCNVYVECVCAREREWEVEEKR